MTVTRDLVPNLDRRPGERYDVLPHGTHAAYARHLHHGEKPCESCRQAECGYRAERRRAYIAADPEWLERDAARGRQKRELARKKRRMPRHPYLLSITPPGQKAGHAC